MADHTTTDGNRTAGGRVAKTRRRGSRYKARRRAVDILFEAEARDIDPVAIVADRRELSAHPDSGVAPVNDYTAIIVDGVAVELNRLDATIERFLSEEWELDRIPAVDRAILRVAAWEILFNVEVPPLAAVTDGVEIGAQYSTDDAAPYIHGVLDTIHKMREQLVTEFAEADAARNPAVQPPHEESTVAPTETDPLLAALSWSEDPFDSYDLRMRKLPEKGTWQPVDQKCCGETPAELSADLPGEKTLPSSTASTTGTCDGKGHFGYEILPGDDPDEDIQ